MEVKRSTTANAAFISLLFGNVRLNGVRYFNNKPPSTTKSIPVI